MCGNKQYLPARAAGQHILSGIPCCNKTSTPA
jgi:hypothetical protein